MSQKSLAKNYLYNTIYRIFIIVVPLITTPYIARVLSPDEVGINSYVSSIINIVTTVGLLGLANYSVREIAYVKNNAQKTNQTFFELFFLRIILLFFTTIIYILYALVDKEYFTYYIIYIFTILGTFLDTSWFFQGEENFKLITVRSFIIKSLSTISIFIFVRHETDLPILMLIYSLTTIVSAIALFPSLRKSLHRPIFRRLDIRRHIAPSLKLFLPQVATLLYCQLDKVMIGNLTGNIAETGFYNQAEKIITIPLALITSLSTVMLPRISEEFIKKNNQKVKTYIYSALQFSMMLALPLMAGIATIASGFIPWFLGAEYSAVIPTLISLSITILFIAMSNVSGNQFLIATDNTKILTISYCSGAIIDLILNFILIPPLGANGAAIATIVTEMAVMIIQFANINFIRLPVIFINSARYIIGALLSASAGIICTFFLQPSILLTTTQICLSILVYFSYLAFSQDKMFLKYVFKILRIKTNNKPSLYINAPKISVGGMERALITLLRAPNFTDNYRITLFVVYSTDSKLLKEIPKNIKVKILAKKWNCLGKLKVAILLPIYELKSLLQYNRYDAAICYSHHHGILARIARMSSQNNICFVHTDLTNSRNKRQLHKLCSKLKFEKFSKIICVSKRAEQSFRKIFPNYKGDLCVIYNLIDYQNIISNSKIPIAQLTKTCPTFLNVSRHDSDNHKKISRIISAAKKLANEKYNFKVILIGDGKEHQNYCRTISRCGLDNYFQILGRITNPYPYFTHADALVIASKFEGYGIIIDEAKVLSLPIISTDIADAKQAIEPYYGKVYPNSNEGVYQGMKDFLNRQFKITKKFSPANYNLENIKKLNFIIMKGIK